MLFIVYMLRRLHDVSPRRVINTMLSLVGLQLSSSLPVHKFYEARRFVTLATHIDF